MEFQEQVRGHGGTEGHFATDEHGLTRIIAKGNAELVWNHEWIRMQGPFGTTNGHECRGGLELRTDTNAVAVFNHEWTRMDTNECSSGFPAQDLLMELQEQVRGHGGTGGHFATD